jgi:GABA(A) receptor-associated protein
MEEDEEKKCREAEIIWKFHSDKVPIMLEKSRNSKLKPFNHKKYILINIRILIVKSFSVFKLIAVIRKKLSLKPTETLYIFAGNALLQADQTLQAVY